MLVNAAADIANCPSLDRLPTPRYRGVFHWVVNKEILRFQPRVVGNCDADLTRSSSVMIGAR